jgi:hypothetical protein
MNMNTKTRIAGGCGALALIGAIFALVGCDFIEDLYHPGHDDPSDPLADKTYTVAASATAAASGDLFFWDGTTTLTIGGTAYTSASSDWATYAPLRDFFKLAGVQDTDTITFDNNGKISKLNKVKTSSSTAIEIKLGSTGIVGEIAGTAFASEVTLTGNTSAGFKLGSAFPVPAGGKLTLAGSTALNLGTYDITATNGSLVLTGGATGSTAAKITGTGKVKAGKTDIVGGTGGWEAIGTAGDGNIITIAALTADTALITAAGTNKPVLTAGAGASITQNKGASNNLTIAADTKINLAGDISSVAIVGTISLKESFTADEGSKITLTAATSIIQVDSSTETAGTAITAAAGDFVLIAAAATTKITASALNGSTGVAVQPGSTTTDKVKQITGGSASSSLQAFGGSGGTATLFIDASTACN